MNLTATTQSLTLTSSSAAALNYSTDYTDIDKTGATVATPGSSQGTIAAATTTTLVTAPASATIYRVITRITIRNVDPAVSNTIAVQKDVSGTPYVLEEVQLAAGRTWNYQNTNAFGVVDFDSPQGADKSVQYNAVGALAGAANVQISDDALQLAVETAPASPSAGFVKLFGRDLADRIMLAMIGPSGLFTTLQPFLGRNKVVRWNPIGNANTTPIADGLVAPTVTGTGTARNVATTNMLTWMKRLGYVSAAGAGSSAGPRSTALQFGLGNGAGIGGFTYVCRFGISDAATVANSRFFVGLIGSGAVIGNVNPSTLTNFFGVGCDNGATSMSMMWNDGAGAATTSALGANFPSQTLSADVYELTMFSAPNSGVVGWRVERLNTGDVASGTISSDLPAGNQLLAPQIWRNNGATALAVGIDLVGLYIETDQ